MALSSTHRRIIEDGARLWESRRALESFWQNSALAFYPEMAQFAGNSMPDDRDFTAHLSSSYPILVRQTLGNAIGSLLRPVALDTSGPGVWFDTSTSQGDRIDGESKRWLEWATKTQRLAMYDRATQFVRTTKEADHSFVAFGQAPIRFSLNRDRDTLLYRHCHLKDVVWTENAEGEIDAVHYRWEPTAAQLAQTFGSKTSPKVREKLEKAPHERIECRNIVMAAENYESRGADGKKFRTPWVSMWIDVANDHLMEETGSWSRIYIIPRWVTVPGSQYATSPCVTAALPDARLLQSIALTIMEAGEKFADPPLVVSDGDVIRSDVDTRSGGLTWIDRDYDERLGDAVRPLYKPEWANGMRGAYELNADVRTMIDKAFFLDSLSLPPAGVKDMTAFEVGQRISEWIRRAMPIFEPIEFEYNGAICEETFDLMMRNGFFGAWQDIPKGIRGADVQFHFESPLHENNDRKKGQVFLEAVAVLGQAAQVDPSVIPMLDARAALRETLEGIGASAKWLRDDEELDRMSEAAAQKEAMTSVMAGVGNAAAIANDLGSAARNFAGARMT